MSLISWWKLDGDATDSKGNYDGIVHGSPSWTNGIIGTAYDNTGNNSNTGVELLQHADASKYDYKHSWSLWFMSTTSSQGTFERILSRDCSEYLCVIIDQSTDPNTLDIGEDIQLNQWYHLVLIARSTSDYDWYLNGNYVGSTSESYNPSYARPWVIGGNTEGDGDISGREFVGKIDDVKFFDHALSLKEVKELSRAKVAHWKLDDDSSIIDSSGYDNHGTNNGATFTTNSKIGSGCYDFDGSNDDIYIGDKDVLDMGTNSFSITAWVKSSVNKREVIFGKKQYSGSGTGYQFLLEDSGELRLFYNDGSDYESATLSGNWNDGNWHFVAVSVNRSIEEIDLYADNSTTTESITQTGDWSTGRSAYIGSQNSSSKYFDGKIDDVRIYSTALTQTEIQQIYEQRAVLDDSGNFYSHEFSEYLYFDGLESGSFGSEWNILDSNFQIYSSPTYQGSYSAGIDVTDTNSSIDIAEISPSSISGGRQIGTFIVYWYETSSSHGGGFRLLDSSGNPVIGVATDNPQLNIEDANGFVEVDGSGSYDTWYKITVIFNWKDGVCDVYRDNDKFPDRPMINNTNVETIKIRNHNAESWQTSDMTMWFDNIQISKLFTITSEGITEATNISEIGPDEGIVGWWPLDGDTKDYVGGNDGTNNGATVTSGIDGLAYEFDGSDDYISIPYFGQDGFTAMTTIAWFKLDNFSGKEGIFNENGTGQGWRVLVDYSDQRIAFQCVTTNSGSLNLIPGDTVNIGEWYHVAAIGTRGDFRLYLNGILIDSSTRDEDITSLTSSSSRIGSTYWSGEWGYINGKIQDVRIYNRALSQEEIHILYELTGGSNSRMKQYRYKLFPKGEINETTI